MKAFLVAALILVLGLNSNAQAVFGLTKSTRMPVDVGVPNTYMCELEEADSKGPYTRVFLFSPDTEDRDLLKIVSITTVRDQTSKLAEPLPKIATVVRPHDGNIYKVKFGEKLNRDKSDLLVSSLKLCVSEQKNKKLTESITSLPQITAPRAGFLKSTLDVMDADQLKAFTLGKDVGNVNGMIINYSAGFDDGYEGGVQKVVTGALESLGRLNGRPNVPGESVKSSGSFVNTSQENGALTATNVSRSQRGSGQSSIYNRPGSSLIRGAGNADGSERPAMRGQ
ncbi:MAG: hypothetical protein JNL11_19310 [Bdellovibrionaceae bacterium]|nr:hypothetical protein [Pseudobdellovibrionaceae bacterium]